MAPTKYSVYLDINRSGLSMLFEISNKIMSIFLCVFNEYLFSNKMELIALGNKKTNTQLQAYTFLHKRH